MPAMAAPARVTLLPTHAWLRRTAPCVAPLALVLAPLLLYLSTLTQVHTFDALSYVTSVERKPWTELFHPHHLAYGPLGALALAFSRAIGYTGSAALPMQLLNATAGALGVGLFFAIARHTTGRADGAFASALLLGGAYAYWYYAIEVEVYTVATLFLLLCLWLVSRQIAHPSLRGMLLLGLAHGGAVLFHQTNLLFCAPVLIALLAARLQGGGRRVQPPRHRLRAAHLAAYGLALALAVGLPYLFVGAGVSGFRTWESFAAWMTAYARTGWWGGPITARTWERLGTGLTDTLAQPGGALLWLLLLGLVVLHLRRLIAAPRPLVAGLVAWLLVYGAFFVWWEPDNIEFWIASLPPALLLLALALRGERRWGPGIWIALAVAGSALAFNHDAIARRGDPATDLQRVIARELGARSRPADLLLVPDGLLELYLPYYEGHDNFLSLNQALFDAGGDWPRACATVRARVEAALHAGATALLSDEVLHPPALLLQRHHLIQAAIDGCFAPYRDALQPIVLGTTLPRYWRLPTGQERAEGEGWHFQGFAEGWQAANVHQERFENGWRFAPGSDPALTSPLLNLKADRYQAIEIRMANATRARDAQLFFTGLDGRFSEAHSVRWTLEPTSEAVTYRIELAGRPGWQGTITRLRLDPVGVGDGDEVWVEGIRLIGAKSRLS